MTTLIEKECLLPSLAIGVPESVFWEKTPKTIQVYFKAYEKQKEWAAKEWRQKMWVMGKYVKNAIETSVFAAGLYDGKHSLPEYPEFPQFEDENNPSDMSEERKEIEKQRLIKFLNGLGKHK